MIVIRTNATPPDMRCTKLRVEVLLAETFAEDTENMYRSGVVLHYVPISALRDFARAGIRFAHMMWHGVIERRERSPHVAQAFRESKVDQAAPAHSFARSGLGKMMGRQRLAR